MPTWRFARRPERKIQTRRGVESASIPHGKFKIKHSRYAPIVKERIGRIEIAMNHLPRQFSVRSLDEWAQGSKLGSPPPKHVFVIWSACQTEVLRCYREWIGNSRMNL